MKKDAWYIVHKTGTPLYGAFEYPSQAINYLNRNLNGSKSFSIIRKQKKEN